MPFSDIIKITSLLCFIVIGFQSIYNLLGWIIGGFYYGLFKKDTYAYDIEKIHKLMQQYRNRGFITLILTAIFVILFFSV